MGLLDNKTHKTHYQSNDFGTYQLTSLHDIINQFMAMYVGDNKVISRINRIDVAFHAKRALQELSFDTFKSIKSQQIDVPNTLVMPLPHDYVNYTKLTWVDSSGIKHPLYPTNRTSNPFEIKQDDDGLYHWGEYENIAINNTFENPLAGTWEYSANTPSSSWDGTRLTGNYYYANFIDNTVSLVDDQLEFAMLWNRGHGVVGESKAYGVWQRIDTSSLNEIDLKATASSGDRQLDGSTVLCEYGVIRVGITSTDPAVGWIHPPNGNTITAYHTSPRNGNAAYPSPNYDETKLDLGYVEWSNGNTSEKELLNIDVSSHSYVWVYIQSYSPWTADAVTGASHTCL